MTIFIVQAHFDYEGFSIKGVYLDRAEAEACADKVGWCHNVTIEAWEAGATEGTEVYERSGDRREHAEVSMGELQRSVNQLRSSALDALISVTRDAFVKDEKKP